MPSRAKLSVVAATGRGLWRGAAWLVVVSTLLTAACAVVPPMRRGALASPAMRSPYARDRTERQYRQKVLESRAGGSLPADAPGGGCACTQ